MREMGRDARYMWWTCCNRHHMITLPLRWEEPRTRCIPTDQFVVLYIYTVRRNRSKELCLLTPFTRGKIHQHIRKHKAKKDDLASRHEFSQEWKDDKESMDPYSPMHKFKKSFHVQPWRPCPTHHHSINHHHYPSSRNTTPSTQLNFSETPDSRPFKFIDVQTHLPNASNLCIIHKPNVGDKERR